MKQPKVQCFVQGKLLDIDQAQIPIHDAGIQHGVGLFETLASRGNLVIDLDAHIQRLINSAGVLGLTQSLDAEALARAVQHTVDANAELIPRGRVRLTVTGGHVSLLGEARGEDQPAKQDPTVMVVVSHAPPIPEQLMTDGAIVAIADDKANPFDITSGHKTLNYWTRLRTLAQAAQLQASEALWFTVTNHLASGCVSNVMLIKQGTLLSPPARGEEVDQSLPSPVLPGVTRARLMQLAENDDIPVQTKMLSITDVLEADEIFLSNSLWGVLPVVQVEKEKIGDGKVGPITRQLAERYEKNIADAE